MEPPTPSDPADGAADPTGAFPPPPTGDPVPGAPPPPVPTSAGTTASTDEPAPAADGDADGTTEDEATSVTGDAPTPEAAEGSTGAETAPEPAATTGSRMADEPATEAVEDGTADDAGTATDAAETATEASADEAGGDPTVVLPPPPPPPVPAAPSSTPGETATRARRGKVLIGLGVVALLAAVVGLLVANGGDDDPTAAARTTTTTAREDADEETPGSLDVRPEEATPSTRPEATGAPDPSDPQGPGEDAALDGLYRSCQAGDYAACDQLYARSGFGTEYERFGATCGGRNEATTAYCTDRYAGSSGGPGATTPSSVVVDASAQSYGDDPQLDRLYDACRGGDFGACDELYLSSPFGSEYERFADTCGGRNEPQGYCEELYG